MGTVLLAPLTAPVTVMLVVPGGVPVLSPAEQPTATPMTTKSRPTARPNSRRRRFAGFIARVSAIRSRPRSTMVNGSTRMMRLGGAGGTMSVRATVLMVRVELVGVPKLEMDAGLNEQVTPCGREPGQE